MSKYFKLTQHLADLTESPWIAEFAEIEAILGGGLPDSARRYPAWWSNQAGDGHTQSNSWQAAGWRTAKLDLRGEKVMFIRDDRPEFTSGAAETGQSPAGSGRDSGGITIQEAKAGLAAYFGVSPESIEIIIKG